MTTRHDNQRDLELARETLSEDMMLGACHLMDGLNSGLTVSEAWAYAQGMANLRAEMAHRLRTDPAMSRAEYSAKREELRGLHKVTAWGYGTAFAGHRALAK